MSASSALVVDESSTSSHGLQPLPLHAILPSQTQFDCKLLSNPDLLPACRYSSN
jgi:hypothetical protein